MAELPEKQPRKTLYLIDGHAQIFRAYHAIRSLSSPVTQEPTNATFGFVGMMLKLFREVGPDYVAVAIDVGGDRGTFRSQIYPEYKANRKEPPEDLHPQVERITEICGLWGIPVLGEPGFEADDIIATLCERLAERDGLNIRIVSRDKDLEQLLGPRVSMYDIHTEKSVDVEALKSNKQLTPEQVVDALALMGDKVDNIPGVEGVGPKTAAKLIAQYGSLDELVRRTDELSGKLRERLEAAKDRLGRNVELVRLRRDVPVEFELERAAVEPPPLEKLRPMFKQLGFNKHLKDLEALGGTGPLPAATQDDSPPLPGGLFDTAEPSPPPQHDRADHANYDAIITVEQLDSVIARIREHVKAGGAISIDTETDQLDPMRAKLCGIALAWEPGRGVYIAVRSCEVHTHLDEAAVLGKLRPLLEDPGAAKVGQNLKYDLIVFRNAGVPLGGVAGERPGAAGGFDTMVASYLIDATRTSHKLDNLALAHLNHEMIPITQLIGTGRKQRSIIDLTVAAVAPYAGEDADIALRLRDHFAPQLSAMGLDELFDELEMPLIEVLAELEFNGILVDPAELDRQKETLDRRIGELHEEVIEAAGVDFNPDSPRQLADVLFDTLGCRVLKRGKTGPSTDSDVLGRITDDTSQPARGSAVAALILEYRQLTKLRGTYLESLKEAIHPGTGRIHASFNQTIAATGRLSSSDPNLQNIPIRTELGRQIRKAFLAPPGCVLLSADYSQIELRLLAHLSGDEGLVEAFRDDRDIHAAVAAEVFGVPLDQVTPEQRSTAKMVNFGIVYGVTPWGLARRLPSSAAGSDPEVAKQIIADYRQRYPKIGDFLDRCVETAESRGYVETISKRRRPIPEVHSRHGNRVALGKRMAINTVVQGSAADLIKIAMVRLHRRIRDERRPLKMLLQIHDELVFEVPRDAADAEAKIVRDEMTRAMELSVPLKVELATGSNWFESK